VGNPDELGEQNVQVLLDRVKKLEQTVNNVSPGNLDPQWTSFSSNNNQTFFGEATKVPVPGLQGRVSKTRLFGQSHWMSSFEHVSLITSIIPRGC
jgi:hypothetical protein